MGNSDFQDDYAEVRERLVGEIRSSKEGKKRLKIKSLLGSFRFTATQRLRQSSLAEVTRQLEQWGIECLIPEARTIDSFITLSLSTHPEPKTPKEILCSPALSVEANQERFSPVSPFDFAFHCGDALLLDKLRSQATALDIQNAIWECRPVCLLVEADDEFFSFACGFLAAIMRRRKRMVGAAAGEIPTTPRIVTFGELKSALGMGQVLTGIGGGQEFPWPGAVYMLEVHRDEPENEDVAASIRDCLVPHTYRLTARDKTNTDRAAATQAEAAPAFSCIKDWFKGFSGSMASKMPLSDPLLDMGSLMAEAAQLRDALLDRKAMRATDVGFRAGFENTEHMVFKSCLLNHLRTRFPNEKIAVEEIVRSPKGQNSEGEDEGRSGRRNKPDLRVGSKIWIEVETLRSGPLVGWNPFFQLELKLRKKSEGMGSVEEVWLMFPSDLALLAFQQLSAITRNLRALVGKTRVRMGFVDVWTEEPIFLKEAPLELPDVELVGASWRTPPPRPERVLSWADVAGYSELKKRLHADLVDPLRNPEKYSQHGLEPASGLLLYGLPGCGKSLIGKVLAGDLDLVCRFLAPSDLTSMWLGEGVGKIRELFDWALKHARCLLVLDELDAVAPKRSEHNMHSDEKRQVNELLVQLDRVAEKGVVVVATTNYVEGIDPAIRRTGRFDIKLPVIPPDHRDRREIFDYYLSSPRLLGFQGIEEIDTARLAEQAVLFTPSDIKAVVESAARRAIQAAEGENAPILAHETLIRAILQQPRSITIDMAREWEQKAAQDLGSEDEGLKWLREEIDRAERAKVGPRVPME